MQNLILPFKNQVALVTGGARRIGAEIVRLLHESGMKVAIQYRSSGEAAETLVHELNSARPQSACAIHADLLANERIRRVIDKTIGEFGRLDALVNNASSFYPSPIGSVTEEAWEDLVGTNLKAPFFLSQAAAVHLTACKGSIVNIVDIHGRRPLKKHAVYCAAKAGLGMLTKALARDLGPEVRVNAVAPGAILWPESGMDELTKKRILSHTALKRGGKPADIARAVLFLIRDARYTTGEMLLVDGGRLLND